jgi:beta-lactam-binding protein with PASTA domain
VALSGVLGGKNTPTTTAPVFVRVPSGLVGGDQFSAVDKLVALGLKANRIQQASREDPGTVLRVAPAGGASVRTGSTVRVFVSKGQDTETVPQITKMTVTEATALLTAHGLVVGDRTDQNDLAAAETVIAQDPTAGSVATKGSAVNITVSKGPKDVPVPDLTGQDEQTARSHLEQAGLVEGSVRRAPSLDQPAGVVISTDPPGDTQQPEGSKVDLLLSSGAPKVTMPEVYGRPIDEAAQLIRDAGLVPRTPSDFPTSDPALDGTVRKTSPQPGVTARKGSPVIISVYTFVPPDTTTTDTTTTDTTTTDTTQLGGGQNQP